MTHEEAVQALDKALNDIMHSTAEARNESRWFNKEFINPRWFAREGFVDGMVPFCKAIIEASNEIPVLTEQDARKNWKAEKGNMRGFAMHWKKENPVKAKA